MEVSLALHFEPRAKSEEAEMVWWPWWLPPPAWVVMMVGLIQVQHFETHVPALVADIAADADAHVEDERAV